MPFIQVPPMINLIKIIEIAEHVHPRARNVKSG